MSERQSSERYVFVCRGAICREVGGLRVRELLERELTRLGDPAVRGCPCFGLCALGPNVFTYPEGGWFDHVRPSRIASLVGQIRGSARIDPPGRRLDAETRARLDVAGKTLARRSLAAWRWWPHS